MISQALIIAGGKGTRLKSIARDIPKPMFPVDGRPVLEHQIEFLKSNRVSRILILTGHLGDIITGYFGDGRAFGVTITYHREDFPSRHRRLREGV